MLSRKEKPSTTRQSAICHRFDPDCKVCGKPIYWQSRIFFAQRVWHLQCFRCCRCGRPLASNESSAIDFDPLTLVQSDKKLTVNKTSTAAVLGEDLALRCAVCQQRFELKKSQKQRYQSQKYQWLCTASTADYAKCALEESSVRSRAVFNDKLSCDGDASSTVDSRSFPVKHDKDCRKLTPDSLDPFACACTGCQLYLINQK
jgi:hypothetical protein